MRKINWIWTIFVVGLGGCSLYPIPDNVSPLSTELIVLYTRCEVRTGILGHMKAKGWITGLTNDSEISSLIKAAKDKEKTHPKKLTDKDNTILRLTKVAIDYSFDFNITESNKNSAGVGFKIPGLTHTLDAGATAALDLTRVGSRVFGTEDNWGELISNETLCKRAREPRGGNILYPITGSLGVDRLVETFIDIEEQGGAKDSFVDTLTFTTSVSGDANASLKINPVSNRFRLISATADIGASRLDVHKLTLSIAFPKEDAPNPNKGVKRKDGDLNAPDSADSPFQRPPAWRARYNLCVQDGRTREAGFKQLRLTDPLVYCIAYADQFAPQLGPPSKKQPVVTVNLLTGASTGPGSGPRSAESNKKTPRERRQNIVPSIVQ